MVALCGLTVVTLVDVSVDSFSHSGGVLCGVGKDSHGKTVRDSPLYSSQSEDRDSHDYWAHYFFAMYFVFTFLST